jgi:hypothetical protein
MKYNFLTYFHHEQTDVLVKPDTNVFEMNFDIF